jgi:DNA-binding PadR family transcriptional regulator
MARKRKTWFAILGLLSWKPMSGYDIKKMVEMGLSHFWSESNLFPTLGALVEEGLATRREDRASGKRTRHVYRITAKGRRAFEKWLREPAEMPQMRNELQLKFFLSARRPVEESIRLLEEYRAQQRARYEEYRVSEVVLRQAVEQGTIDPELDEVLTRYHITGDNMNNELLIFLLTLRHGILAIEARLAWIDEAVGALRDVEIN